ncbi:MAG: ATP-binding protein [Pseudomonadota bacterium]
MNFFRQKFLHENMLSRHGLVLSAFAVILGGLSLTGFIYAQTMSGPIVAIAAYFVLLSAGCVIYFLFIDRISHVVEKHELIRAKEGAESVGSEKSGLLQNIIDNAVEGMVTIDEAGIVQIFNPACERIFGYGANDIVGKSVSILMPEAHRSGHDGYVRAYCRTGEAKAIGISREVQGRHRDGTTIPLDLSVSEVRLNGRRMFSGFVRDISERKSVEDQLRTYMTELEWFRAVAEKGTRLKSEFLATMSHEIRTPMNGVIGMTELLMETGLNVRQQRYADVVMRSARALLDIINDILDFSKIEAGRLTLEPLPLDFRRLSQEAIELFSVRASEKGLELLLDYSGGAARHILGDAGRIQQILSNLLGNAIKFTDRGRIEMIVEGLEPPQNRLKDAKIKVSVKDTGIGIPQEAQVMLFNKFTQADASTSRKYGGTGLGLAICKQLAMLMDGEVGVESVQGKGSVFWFTMILPVVDEKAVAAVHPEPAEKAKPEILNGVRVLLVEDNVINQEFALEILRSFGCRSTLAVDGRQAIRCVEDGNAYDLILMDCQMPEVDGYEATRHIRKYFKQRSLPPVPIIAMTANAMKGEREKCMKAGMDDYLSKPFLKKDMEVVLTRWIRGVPDAEAAVQQRTEKEGLPDDGIDRGALAAVRELMKDRYAEIVRKYIGNTDAVISKIGQAFAGNASPVDIAMDAHALKSSSLYLGAVPVSEAAHNLEVAARAAMEQKRPAEELRPCLEALKKAWQAVRASYVREAEGHGDSPGAQTH